MTDAKTGRASGQNRRLKQDGLLTASPFLLPSLVGLMVFSLLPLLTSALISLTDWNGLDELLSADFLREHYIGLENYQTILGSAEFWQALGNTCRYILLYIPLMLVASLLVANLLSRPRRGVAAFRILYYIPVLTSWVAASLIWKTVLSPQYGAMNSLLAFFGIKGPGWLLDEAWAMPAIVLVSVWKDMMRPLVYEWPEAEEACSCEDEYLLGEALLVAPFLEENETSRMVWLPKGRWFGFFDSSVQEGGCEIKAGGNGKLPVFIRSGWEHIFKK